MGKIKILDQFLIDRIAAGEVVQRPLNIVKELLENSIDAKSTSIVVEIKDGGKSYIRITDNGIGMASEDALISYKRHATSKISHFKDLDAIGTLGFRGEALSAIASVSHMQIMTKTKNEDSGIVLSISGGVLDDKKYVGMADGTNIIVKNLFYNTPARLKFLKNNGVEASAVSDIISRFILAFPSVAFKFISNDKIIMQSFGDGSLTTCINAIYGDDARKKTMDVNYQDEGIKISGVIGTPQYAYKNRKMQTLLVNGRYVLNQRIANAIKSAYSKWLVPGLFPFYVLNIDIPAEEIDVNIHPNKLEIKFKDDKMINRAITEAIIFTLDCERSMPKISLGDKSKVDDFEKQDKKIDAIKVEVINKDDIDSDIEIKVAPKEETPIIQKQSISIEKPIKQVEKHNIINDTFGIETTTLPIMDDYTKKKTVVKNSDIFEVDDNKSFELDMIKEVEPKLPLKVEVDLDVEVDVKESIDPIYDGETIKVLPDSEIIKHRYIGTFLNSYLLFEHGTDLLLVDQHAVHEKIIFDSLLKAFLQDKVDTQMLMIPQRVKLSLEENNMIIENIGLLEKMGFVLELNEDLSVDFSGIPALLSSCTLDQLLDDVFSAIDNNEQYLNKNIEKIIMKSCKRAVKAGSQIDYKEAEYLIEEFIKTGGVPNCPHGRPIIAVLSEKEIKKYFRRIV